MAMRDNYKEETKKYLKSVLKMLKEMNLLEKADEASLTLLGDSYELYLQCLDDIKRNGVTQGGAHGRTVNPSVTLQVRLTNTILTILKEFGVSARSRKLMMRNVQFEDEESPINQFLDKMRLYEE